MQYKVYNDASSNVRFYFFKILALALTAKALMLEV